MQAGMTLYIVRHGETDWNRDRRYQGQRDIPLNVVGRAQALRNGEALRQLLPAIAAVDFVASHLSRARETMEIMRGALGLPPETYTVDERLRELSYGSWEGQLQADLPRLDPEGWTTRKLDPYRWRPSGGESYADLMLRTVDWLSGASRDTLVAAHGGVVRTLQAHVCGLDPERVPILEAPQDKVLILRDGQMQWL
jgi:broad specificity phosphatase PhoE